MGYPKRTACCEKCGSVGFKIRSKVGCTEYVCSECYTHFAEVNCNSYESLKTLCTKCSSEVFKIKIEENNGEEKLTVGCINCKEPPSVIFVDEEGHEVDRIIKELLVIKKSIDNLENDVIGIATDIKEMDFRVDDISNRVNDDKDSINKKIEDINKVIDKQRIKTISMDNEVNKIRNRLNNMTNY